MLNDLIFVHSKTFNVTLINFDKNNLVPVSVAFLFDDYLNNSSDVLFQFDANK